MIKTSLASPPRFRIADKNTNHILLESERGAVAHVFVLEDDIIRVMVLPDGVVKFPKIWAIAPGAEDVASEGRGRFDLAGFSLPKFKLAETGETLCIETAMIRLTIRLDGFFCAWEILHEGKWQRAARDRPTQAYNFGWWDERVHHYLACDGHERYFGLGERSGEMDRAGRRFRMTNIDAMGYSAKNSDPLYKHIPFYITARPESGLAFGLFYDTLSDCVFDMGCERDNYHGLYRHFAAEHGDLDYYMIASGSLREIVRRQTWLTGRPAFLPKWGLGYSGSTMSYTDAPDAQARMSEFLEKCEKHDILCDSFHLSSGYTSIGSKRYVFHWNREKFPDPAAFAKTYADKGVRLAANIKPCLLRDHPSFAEARDKGLLIADESGEPGLVQFWGELGAYLDFTNPEAVLWWKAHVKTALLDFGIAATWNDNNEFEIVGDAARIDFFGAPRPAREAKPLQALLMMRASRQAQIEHDPARRPFVVSRSGAAGMQRYAQTWSGDNETSWETLKYNIKMGLGLALSGISNTGHDVGGFAGPAPDAELFVRWVGFGIFMPRFSIHSWNDDGTVNEPWMHSSVTPQIRDLIKLRYRLLPYLYDLTWKYMRDYEPIIRPTFLDFPGDARCHDENDEMMLGASLLVAPVVVPGQTAREVYLPGCTQWYDFWSGEVFAGGQAVTVPAPFDKPLLFAREASVIAVNLAEQHFSARADRRGFLLFPPTGDGAFETEIFEDDGETDVWRDGKLRLWRVMVDCRADRIAIDIVCEDDGKSIASDVEIILPVTERRSVAVTGGHRA